jgi:TonB family protein
MRLALACVLSTTLATLAAQAGPTRIAPQQAKDHVGKVVTVCGNAILSSCNYSTNAFMVHLDQPDWTIETGVTLVIARDRRLLPGWENAFLGRAVCATGRVEAQERGFAVVLDDPAQPVLDGPNQPAPPVFGVGAARCDPRVFEPRAVSSPQPTYPPAALKAGKCGQVSLEAVVLADGSVGDVRVVHSIDSSPDGLDQAAAAALKRWRFEPALRAGDPTPAIMRTEMGFHIKGEC